MRITILCENSVARPGQLIGEHGFAALIETAGSRWLFDTGSGLGLLNNARETGSDLKSLQGVILSHGHYDHTGGLLPLLQHLDRPLPVYGHPGIFAERYWVSDFERRPIGLPFSRAELETAGAVFDLQKEGRELEPGLWLSGEIRRNTLFEKPDPHLILVTPSDERIDPVDDDLSLFLQTDKGLVVLLGCAHAGVVNILDAAIARTGDERIALLAGGTHLGPADEEQFAATLAALERYRIGRIAVSHCTGLARAARMSSSFAGRFFFAGAGTRLDV